MLHRMKNIKDTSEFCDLTILTSLGCWKTWTGRADIGKLSLSEDYRVKRSHAK